MELVTVYDCISANLGHFQIPPGVFMMGYATGSGAVPWTGQQFTEHPGAIRVDQSPADTPQDETADVLDVEPLAATIADVPIWVHAAWTSYRAGRRPGQRTPTIYVEESELTPAANTLNAAGITNGVNLFLSKPMSATEAYALLNAAGGPFPIVGVQYEFNQLFDVSVVSKEWLDNVSKLPVNSPPKPAMQTGWRFCWKCQGLFWGPGQQQSFCPMQGRHDGSKSHEYTLEFVR